MIYMYANLQKFWNWGSNYFKYQNIAPWISFQTPDNLAESGLTVSYFCNAISPWDLDGVCHAECSSRFMARLRAFLVQV
jgi:hypothetical protein